MNTKDFCVSQAEAYRVQARAQAFVVDPPVDVALAGPSFVESTSLPDVPFTIVFYLARGDAHLFILEKKERHGIKISRYRQGYKKNKRPFSSRRRVLMAQ